ncbi:hypothetical protein SOVF_077230 isoform D [Spinacia oleracea]|nr:hypothetical protein SOVF_077230 isoform D [Spinacia oleracea]
MYPISEPRKKIRFLFYILLTPPCTQRCQNISSFAFGNLLETHHRDYRIAGCSELLTFRLCSGLALTGHSWHWDISKNMTSESIVKGSGLQSLMQVLNDVKIFQVLRSEICLERHHRDYSFSGPARNFRLSTGNSLSDNVVGCEQTVWAWNKQRMCDFIWAYGSDIARLFNG